MKKHLATHRDDSHTTCASQSYSCFCLLDSASAYYAASHCDRVERTTHSRVAGTIDAVGLSIAGHGNCNHCWQVLKDGEQCLEH
jgi:hypothetical protein